MSKKQIVKQILNHEKPDKVAFTCLNNVMWDCTNNNYTCADFMDMPDGGAERQVNLFREMKCDIIVVGSALRNIMFDAMGGETNYAMAAPELTKKPLDSIQDIDKLDVDEVIKNMKAAPEYKKMIQQVKCAKEMATEDELICAYALSPFTAAGKMIGLQELMIAAVNDMDGIKKVLRFATKVIVAYLEGMVEAGGEGVLVGDPMSSGDLISPKMYETLVMPVMKEMVDAIHKFCPYTMVHICGDTTTRPKYVVEAGLDVLSVSDIDMAKASEDAEGKLVMMGNINPATDLCEKSADEIYAMSMELCKSMANSGGFILCPGCDLAPQVPLENIQAMARAAADYNASLE